MCLLAGDSAHGGVVCVLGAVVDDLELLWVKELRELLRETAQGIL